MTKAKILIVEDSKNMREILIKILNELGFSNIFGAENGKIAWETLQNSQFDLIISDLMMPEMDGFELLKRIRNSDSQLKNIPVIIASASHDSSDMEETFKWKVSGYLTKPFSVKSVLSKIKGALGVIANT